MSLKKKISIDVLCVGASTYDLVYTVDRDLQPDEKIRATSFIGCGGGRVSIYSEPVDAKAIYKDYKAHGRWTVDELIDLVPTSLLVGYVNPAPPEA